MDRKEFRYLYVHYRTHDYMLEDYTPNEQISYQQKIEQLDNQRPDEYRVRATARDMYKEPNVYFQWFILNQPFLIKTLNPVKLP